MKVGVITGTGTYALPGFEADAVRPVGTRFGEALVTPGQMEAVEVLHISRHGEGHRRLSNHVNHRANIWALKELRADAVIACTACGALDLDVPLGGLIFFDELHFIVNRLPDGSLCTLYGEPGHPDRGHWIIGPPFSPELRAVVVAAGAEAGVNARDGGCYGHVGRPRLNTRT